MAGTLTKNVKFYMGANTQTPTYTQVADLQNFPALMGGAERVDVTTLADSFRHSIPGVKDLGTLAFTFLYNNAAGGNFRTLKTAEGTEQAVKIEFPDGTNFTFTGYVECQINGAGVNEALTFVCNIFMTSDITVTNPV